MCCSALLLGSWDSPSLARRKFWSWVWSSPIFPRQPPSSPLPRRVCHPPCYCLGWCDCSLHVLTWLGYKDAQIAGKALLLGMSAKVFLEGSSIWIGELSKADGSSQSVLASSNLLLAWIEQKDGRRANLLSVGIGPSSSAPVHWCSLFSDWVMLPAL